MLSFYTMPEYESWSESVNTAGWKIKYYKGLGTSTQEEAQEYFADIERHRKSFVWSGASQGPGNSCLDLVHLCVCGAFECLESLFSQISDCI